MPLRAVSGVWPAPRKGPLRDRDPCRLRTPRRPGSGSEFAVHLEALTHSVSSRKIAPIVGEHGMQAVGIGEGGKEEKVLETSVGETFTIRLWEDRTRGEILVPSYDPEALALLSDEYERSFGDSNNAIDAGKRAFEFRALKPGVHRIVFEKRIGAQS